MTENKHIRDEMLSEDNSKDNWFTTDTPNSRLQAFAVKLTNAGFLLAQNPLGFIGFLIILALILVSILAPWIATHDPNAQDLALRLTAPGEHGYIFGSDELGRDIFSRIVYGAGVTLYIVSLVALTAPLAGLIVGTVAGYFGGWVDTLLMRFTDIALAFPRLILALAFIAAVGPGIENAVLAIALTAWPPYARLARAETLLIRGSDYIAAVQLQGASSVRIIWRHIMPLCLSSIVVRATLDMAGIILIAAGLGFLGMGAQPPMAEWGAMVSSGRNYLLDHWWVGTIPGLAIFIVSLGFNLLGDGLRDILDPKSGENNG